MLENKVFEKETTKKILKKNFLVDMKNEEQNRIPKGLFFFDFPTTLKQIKIRFLAQKHVLKTLLETLEKMEKIAPEILTKTGLKNPYL